MEKTEQRKTASYPLRTSISSMNPTHRKRELVMPIALSNKLNLSVATLPSTEEGRKYHRELWTKEQRSPIGKNTKDLKAANKHDLLTISVASTFYASCLIVLLSVITML